MNLLRVYGFQLTLCPRIINTLLSLFPVLASCVSCTPTTSTTNAYLTNLLCCSPLNISYSLISFLVSFVASLHSHITKCLSPVSWYSNRIASPWIDICNIPFMCPQFLPNAFFSYFLNTSFVFSRSTSPCFLLLYILTLHAKVIQLSIIYIRSAQRLVETYHWQVCIFLLRLYRHLHDRFISIQLLHAFNRRQLFLFLSQAFFTLESVVSFQLEESCNFPFRNKYFLPLPSHHSLPCYSILLADPKIFPHLKPSYPYHIAFPIEWSTIFLLQPLVSCPTMLR